MQSSKPNILTLIERSMDVAERFDQLGPIGVGSLAWQALPQAYRERMLGQCCDDCGLAASVCECCDRCGWTPCTCPDKFPRATYEAEGVPID